MSLINVSTSLLFLVALLLNAFVNVSAFTNYQRQGSTAVRDGIIGSRAKNFGVLYASAKNIIHLDDSNYRKILSGNRPVLVDAYTQWCVITRSAGGNFCFRNKKTQILDISPCV